MIASWELALHQPHIEMDKNAVRTHLLATVEVFSPVGVKTARCDLWQGET